MRSPDYYLRQLLFDYDCVTIPDFGGFIIQSKHAKLDRTRHRIYPPERQPSFNSLLTHDDGLLISSISKIGGIPYSAAAAIVRDFAKDLNRKISQGENVVLEGIGELKKSVEGGIIFQPAQQANFHALTFGMGTVSLYPVSRQPQKARMVQKPADRTAGAFRERKPASVRWTLAISLPVILFLLYGIIFPSSIQELYTNYSGIVIDLVLPKQAEPAAPRESYEVKAIPAPVKAPEIIASPVIRPETEFKPEGKAIVAIQPAQKYYIIGGCFEKEENAQRFLDRLLDNGYEAEKAGVTKKGHFRISYKSFAEKDPALSYLQKIRDEENPSAWLLKY